ncbi:MAG: DUF559 domain-containing protein [Nitrospirae bacterium]|nr:DUF559 domain-containing protein [Nitrospirota bacterium]
MRSLRNDPLLKQRRQELRNNQTEAERVFWSLVRNRQFKGKRFFRQYSIGPYVLDFYCPEIKLAIELDGGQHSDNREYDALRTEFLNAHGVEVIRFWNNEVIHGKEGILNRLLLKVTPPNLPLAQGEGQ